MSATRQRQVTVIGGSQIEPGSELEATAEEVGRRLAEAGAAVVCGGMTGVMEAACRGAFEAGGTTIGILPTESHDDANPFCTHLVVTGIGHARNLAVVASGEAVIAVGGEWGTLSEIAMARSIGRPVIGLLTWTLNGRGRMDGAPGVTPAESAEEAVAAAIAAIA